MKSSWKRQRLASKNRNIKLMKWKNRFIRKYGYENIAKLAVNVSKVVRAIAENLYSILKVFQRNNEVIE